MGAQGDGPTGGDVPPGGGPSGRNPWIAPDEIAAPPPPSGWGPPPPGPGWGAQPPGAYGSQPGAYAPGPYAPGPYAAGPYAAGPYAAGPYGGQGPYGYAMPMLPKGGDARTGPLPLHPMALGDILDGAFKLYKANVKAIVIIVLCFAGPLAVLSAIFSASALSHISFGSDATVQDSPANNLAPQIGQLLTALASFIVQPFIAGALAKVVASSYLGAPITAGQAVRASLRRFLSLFGGWLLVHLVELIGFVLAGVLLALAIGSSGGAVVGLLIVGFIALPLSALLAIAIMPLWVAVAPAIVVEELGPIRGMRRSYSLTNGRYWPVLGTALLAGLISSIIGQVIAVPAALGGLATVSLVGPGVGAIVLAIGSLLQQVAVIPLTAIVATLIYFDLRIRNEAFDLAVLSNDLRLSASVG